MKRLIALFKKEWKKTPFAVGVALLSVLVGVGSLVVSVLTFKIVRKDVFEITVGVVPYQFNTKDRSLDEVLTMEYERINRTLRGMGMRYRFAVQPNTGEYNYLDLMSSLNNGKVNMGYVPMGVYHSWLVNNKTLDGFEIVGYKKAAPVDKPDNCESYYRGVLIWNEQPGNKLNEVFAAESWVGVRRMLESGECKIWMGDDQSMSSNIVQRMFLMSKQIEVSKEHTVHRNNFSKLRLVDSILSPNAQRCYIGAISEDDYYEIPEQKRLLLKKIDIPVLIPYDVILVNKERWGKVPPRDRKAIVETMRGWENGRRWAVEPCRGSKNDPLMGNVENFGLWMKSAIVCRREIKGDSVAVYYAKRPLKEANLYGEWTASKDYQAEVGAFVWSEEDKKCEYEHLHRVKYSFAGINRDSIRFEVPLRDTACVRIGYSLIPVNLFDKAGK